MSEVEKEIRRDKGHIQDLAFKIFAVVGFLSSIVTIGSWLSSTSASLSETVTPTTIEMPADLQFSKISSGPYDINSAISDLRDKYCNPVEADYTGNKSKNFFYSADKCDSSRSIFDSIGKAVKLDGKKLLAWDVNLSNDGKNVAENVVLRTQVPVSVLAKDADGNVLPAKSSDASGKVFTLPNLNPKDSIKMRIISSTPVPEEYDPVIAQPKVVYSGGVASNKQFISVSGRYSEIAKFLDDLPTVLQILIVVGAALIITLLWMAPIGMAMDLNEKRKKADAGEATG